MPRIYYANSPICILLYAKLLLYIPARHSVPLNHEYFVPITRRRFEIEIKQFDASVEVWFFHFRLNYDIFNRCLLLICDLKCVVGAWGKIFFYGAIDKNSLLTMPLFLRNSRRMTSHLRAKREKGFFKHANNKFCLAIRTFYWQGVYQESLRGIFLIVRKYEIFNSAANNWD